MRNTNGISNSQRLGSLLHFDGATQPPTSSREELEQRLSESSRSIKETHDRIRRNLTNTHENPYNAHQTASKLSVRPSHGTKSSTTHSSLRDFVQRTEDRAMAMKDLQVSPRASHGSHLRSRTQRPAESTPEGAVNESS